MVKSYRALIVDDEQAVRSLTVRAMSHEQFNCDEAADGDQADAMCQRERYDVVVTDLKMPRGNGYSLACGLLGRDDRPMIAVLTGVLEPRLAKDLYARGVDHIEFKPIDYDLFATKLRSLLARRVQTAAPLGSPPDNAAVDRQEHTPPTGQLAVITLGEVETRLKRLARIMPMSQAALDVVDVVHADHTNATQAAAAIARDASLAVEVLKLANSSFYNPSGERIVSLEQAVVRIGTRRVGELALAATVLTSLTTGVLPWMDVDLAWRRSIAAGLAVDWLVESANLEEQHEGLFLCALMHGLGRIALGTVFPEEYESMVNKCRANNASLVDLERALFPESAVETMMRLLSIWNVPTAECEPLKYLSHEYAALSGLDEVTRRKVELLKLSVLIGQLAVVQWEPWDVVELPPASVVERLHVAAVSKIVEQTRADLFEVVNFRKRPHMQGERPTKSDHLESHRLAYRKLHCDHIDFLPEILRCMNVEPVPSGLTDLDPGEPILINRLGVGANELGAPMNSKAMEAGRRLIVTELDSPRPHHPNAELIRLPCSFAALQSCLQELLRPEP
ncbi:MAG: HDOD domain-containing protein [Planctomycetia bacterium]|nr:HDOD domain-containing protein [Planctomycetia bacterium]